MSKQLVFKRILFYIASYTWGIIMSLIGGIIFLTLLCCGCESHIYYGRPYIVIGERWGGFSAGCFFFVCRQSRHDNHVRSHECGHGLQNALFGPLFPFIIAIPSAIRYWYLSIKYYNKGIASPKPYDSAWFEHQATVWGEKYIIGEKW